MGVKLKKEVSLESNPVTEYMVGGFQYFNQRLKHFPHAEGYVDVIEDTYNYVFHYTDHLGNIRLSYSDANKDNFIDENEIIEENNYYPFGLKHTAYNTNEQQYVSDEELNEIILELLPKYEGDGSYKYKFQGQERQDELGLNWDSFKWRNYDYTIGRFMNIDPLTEEYHTWSPYVFSGNRVIDARELEGLEPYSVHNSYSEAVSNFAQYYNGYSMENKVEVTTNFYQNQDGTYSYAHPMKFTTAMADATQVQIPEGTSFLGSGHTHGGNATKQLMQSEDSSGNPIIANGLSPQKILDLLAKGFVMQEEANGVSPDDKEFVKNVDSKYETFRGSFVVTPSGLVYNLTLDGNGQVISRVDKKISKTTPSSGEVRVNTVNPTVELKENELPIQGQLKIE